MIELMWWHWAVLGFGFIVAELVVPAFVLIWFGLGGFLVMLAMLLLPALTLEAQLLIWTLSSILMIVLWFRIFKRNEHKTLAGQSADAIMGEVGMLNSNVEPFKNGKVRFQRPILGSDLWECVSDEKLETGTRVRVISVEGSRVKIASLKEKES